MSSVEVFVLEYYERLCLSGSEIGKFSHKNLTTFLQGVYAVKYAACGNIGAATSVSIQICFYLFLSSLLMQ